MSDEDLSNALDGLFAHDLGATTGIHDEALRSRCIAELGARPWGEHETAPRLFLSRHIRDRYLSEESLSAGYGIEDVKSFIGWLGDWMGVEI